MQHHTPRDTDTQTDKAVIICAAMNNITEDIEHMIDLIADYTDTYQEFPDILVKRLEALADALATAATALSPDYMDILTSFEAEEGTP